MKIHFLGIGGSGASAAANIALARGYEISGCDLEPNNEFTINFDPSVLSSGHSPSHMTSGNSNIDMLIVTPAIFLYDPQNPELVAAKEKSIPVMTWQQFVGKYLSKEKFVITVCGTHGKSTTTAMIGKMLEDGGLDPTVILGATVPEWKGNFRTSHRHPERSEGSKDYIVIEADEYYDNFLSYTPDINVVTNIEMDHPEYFKDFESYKESFKKLLLQTKGTNVANLSDPVVQKLLASHTPSGNTVVDYSKNLIDFPLQIPGQFNILNASAAYQVGILLGIEPAVIQQSLSNYTGVGRRFELIGTYHNAKVYSDFGHHPTEIKTTMEAARGKFPNSRILLIYQPHMFTRTKYLFDDFVKVFHNIPADKTFIMDIYPSREIDRGEVSSSKLVDAVHSNTVVYCSNDKILDILKKEIKVGDIVFFMSAGDTDKLAKDLVKA